MAELELSEHFERNQVVRVRRKLPITRVPPQPVHGGLPLVFLFQVSPAGLPGSHLVPYGEVYLVVSQLSKGRWTVDGSFLLQEMRVET